MFALSTDSDNLCTHFGRAPEYTILTIQNNKLVDKKTISNPGHTVGRIPKFLKDQCVDFIITEGMDQRTLGFFKEYRKDIILGMSGKIDVFINKILEGSLIDIEEPDHLMNEYSLRLQLIWNSNESFF